MFLGAAALLALTGCGAQADTTEASSKTSPSPSASVEEMSPLREAYVDCAPQKGGRTLTQGDSGKSIIIDTESEYGSVKGLFCVLMDLNTSDAIWAQIQHTTAMMGVQQADQDGLHYLWSYHPDNGVNMTITDTGAKQ